MPLPEIHVFVCLNQRAAENPKGCCASKGAMQMFTRLKMTVKRDMPGVKIRVNRAGCLDLCEHGASMVVYPEGVWYGGVTVDDVDEIIQSHLQGGRPVQRLIVREAVR